MPTTVEATYEDGKLVLQQPLPLPNKAQVRVTVDSEYPWLDQVLADLKDLADLPPNWDGSGAKPIDPECVTFVVDKVLAPCMRITTPLPTIVPLNKGGVMLEWHQKGIDLEVRVEMPGSISMFYADSQSESEIEEDISMDISHLQSALDLLASRN